jgi:hypothetical protein
MNNIHSSLAFHSTTALRFPSIASIVRLAPSFAFSFIFSFLQAQSIAQPESRSRKKIYFIVALDTQSHLCNSPRRDDGNTHQSAAPAWTLAARHLSSHMQGRRFFGALA